MSNEHTNTLCVLCVRIYVVSICMAQANRTTTASGMNRIVACVYTVQPLAAAMMMMMLLMMTTTTTPTAVTAARQNNRLFASACLLLNRLPLCVSTSTFTAKRYTRSCSYSCSVWSLAIRHNKTEALHTNWIQLWFDCRWVSTTLAARNSFIHSPHALVYAERVSPLKYRFTWTNEHTNKIQSEYLHALANLRTVLTEYWKVRY